PTDAGRRPTPRPRSGRCPLSPRSPPPAAACAALVRILRRRRADRIWAVHLRLSHRAWMDAGRYRPHPHRLAGLALQRPGGAIVDAARSLRGVAALAMIAVSASALAIALWPIFPSVLAAQILQAAGSSVVSPAIAAISLGLVGYAARRGTLRP